MALPIGNTSARGSVGLDIDGGFLAAVQVGNGRVERAVSTELPEGIVSAGEVADKDALAAALKHFFKDAGLPKSVRLGVANEQIVVRQLELPRIEDGKELTAAVRFQAAETIAMPLEEAVLDYQVTARTNGGDDGPRMQVVVVAARQSMVDELVAATRGAGLRPEGIDLSAFALLRALGSGSQQDNATRVYCHLGGVTNLAVAAGPTCLFTRPLRSGWDGHDVEGTAAQLADEIGLSIDYYMAQPEARPVDELVLSGPGARRQGLAEALGARLQRPATVAQPLGGLDISSLGTDEDPYRHTVAAGLALGTA
jgi:type IV pilus assembly protein PilM